MTDWNTGVLQIEPGRILKEVFRIYREQAGVLLPVALVLFGINAIVGYVLQEGALALIASIVSLVVSTFYQGMVVQLVRDVIDGRRDSSVGDLLRSVSPVVLTLIVVSILAGIGIVIGFILIIIPGLFLLTIWSVVAPVVVVEQPGVLDAFGRSRALVKGHGWQVFGVIVLVFLLLIAVGIVTAVLVSSMGDAGGTVVGWLLNVLVAPISALVAAVLYFALRVVHGEPARPEDAVAWMPPVAPA
jgi:Uncharacterised protein family (UPF0259)